VVPRNVAITVSLLQTLKTGHWVGHALNPFRSLLLFPHRSSTLLPCYNSMEYMSPTLRALYE
jgi:hypothetical protein